MVQAPRVCRKSNTPQQDDMNAMANGQNKTHMAHSLFFRWTMAFMTAPAMRQPHQITRVMA